MGALRTVTVVVAMGTLGMAASSPETARKSMAAIVARIQKADYEGDRKALVRLAAELAPCTMNRSLASRARYWRGFALWRRALNGFNEKDANPKEIERVSRRTLPCHPEPPGSPPVILSRRRRRRIS